jgi:hypothetical protein
MRLRGHRRRGCDGRRTYTSPGRARRGARARRRARADSKGAARRAASSPTRLGWRSGGFHRRGQLTADASSSGSALPAVLRAGWRADGSGVGDGHGAPGAAARSTAAARGVHAPPYAGRGSAAVRPSPPAPTARSEPRADWSVRRYRHRYCPHPPIRRLRPRRARDKQRGCGPAPRARERPARRRATPASRPRGRPGPAGASTPALSWRDGHGWCDYLAGVAPSGRLRGLTLRGWRSCCDRTTATACRPRSGRRGEAWAALRCSSSPALSQLTFSRHRAGRFCARGTRWVAGGRAGARGRADTAALPGPPDRASRASRGPAGGLTALRGRPGPHRSAARPGYSGVARRLTWRCRRRGPRRPAAAPPHGPSQARSGSPVAPRA